MLDLTGCYEDATEVLEFADIPLLREQTALVGGIADNPDVPQDQRDLAEGLWNFLHDLLDTVED